MNKPRTRLAFLILWGLLFLSAQIPLMIIYTAVNFEQYTVAVSEILAAIFTSMMAALMVAKEEM
jgi:hypothetical protein